MPPILDVVSNVSIRLVYLDVDSQLVLLVTQLILADDIIETDVCGLQHARA